MKGENRRRTAAKAMTPAVAKYAGALVSHNSTCGDHRRRRRRDRPRAARARARAPDASRRDARAPPITRPPPSCAGSAASRCRPGGKITTNTRASWRLMLAYETLLLRARRARVVRPGLPAAAADAPP